jgi:hypothetical protein
MSSALLISPQVDATFPAKNSRATDGNTADTPHYKQNCKSKFQIYYLNGIILDRNVQANNRNPPVTPKHFYISYKFESTETEKTDGTATLNW